MDSNNKHNASSSKLPTSNIQTAKAKDKAMLDQIQHLISLNLDPVWGTALHKGYQINKVLGAGAYGVVVSAKNPKGR